MLREETVVSGMLDIIRDIQGNPIFKDFYLAGGTALALQLGHRTSTDADLFSYKDSDFSAINDYLRKNNDKFLIDTLQDNFSRVFVNNIKVEFVHDMYGKLIIPPINENGITLLSKEEIAPMKIYANYSRKKARDIIDIAFLVQEMSLETIFDLYQQKYGRSDINILKRSLIVKSDIIKEDDSLANIKIIRNDISLDDIPIIIREAVDKYNRNNGIGIIKPFTNTDNKE